MGEGIYKQLIASFHLGSPPYSPFEVAIQPGIFAKLIQITVKCWRTEINLIDVYISELIFQKVATEIEHNLRLSTLKEYASH